MREDREKQALIGNLKDAGCDQETVDRFLSCWAEEKTGEQLRLLDKQRKQLLDRVHQEEKRITCLDYLVYQIQKTAK